MSSSSSASPPPVDMSIKIGGRQVTPAFPVVDGSPPTSNPSDVAFDQHLSRYVARNVPLESPAGIQRRERVLDRMGALCRAWIGGVCRRQQLPEDVVSAAGGQLFTSGSYRLGVHEPGADIDTILVAPNMCTREDFFGAVVREDADGHEVRDPTSLAERIRTHPDVTNFVAVEGAAVPILTFDWEGVNIDLLFARLASASVPPDLDIDNDGVLDGVDSATEKSLNGPRVTNLIAALVSGTPKRYQSFLTTVRCVRKWAKARGLYSNKMGYWGGVNINIAVALVIQLYPNASPASLLRKFFLVFKSWRWPNPVMLTRPHDAKLGLQVWSAYGAAAARQIAPIITPAYPAMNSTLSVSRQTLQIMSEEFLRGHEIVDRLWKDFKSSGAGPPSSSPGDDGGMFAELFEPSDFFIAYPNYLSLCIVGPTQDDTQGWAGFVESRLRKLVSDLLGRSLPLQKIQLWPKKFEACVVDRSAAVHLSSAQRKNCLTYFIGFRVDKLRMRGRQLDIERQMQNFREYELTKFQPLVVGQDVLARAYRVYELPRIVFDETYGEKVGKEGAMKRRRALREADPKRRERKRLAKLAELKARMAQMQKKVEEKKKMEEGGGGEGEGDDEKGVGGVVKEEDVMDHEEEPSGEKQEKASGADGDVDTPDKDEEEDEDLLEHALDNIQDIETGGAAKKTREEAELDRKKLLAGELLTGGTGKDGAADEDNEDAYDDEDDGAGDYDPGAIIAGDELSKRPRVPPSAAKRQKVMTLAEREAEILKRAGYSVVSDDEVTILGGSSFVPVWKRRRQDVMEQQKQNDKGGDEADGSTSQRPTRYKIKFLTKFDVVELDAHGFVIDKGDDDYIPSKSWTGRRGGFEFKLGERGLGYYRTGKKVVVPSNVAY